MTFHYSENVNKGENVLLTGIPRSGTTLACRLLCEYSDTIALNEPMNYEQFSGPAEAIENIDAHFIKFRKSLLADGTAVARTKDGMITDNAFNDDDTSRKKVIRRTSVTFNKNLNPDFTLVMKHCSEFTLLLPGLSEKFRIYAIIRNPLALLCSWASVDVGVSRGQVSKSERLNPEFNEWLNQQSPDLLQRQLAILSWYFKQYESLPSDQIIRYEDLIETPSSYLLPLKKGELEKPFQQLSNKNESSLYGGMNIQNVTDSLLNSEGHYWKFYSAADVSGLLKKYHS